MACARLLPNSWNCLPTSCQLLPLVWSLVVLLSGRVFGSSFILTNLQYFHNFLSYLRSPVSKVASIYFDILIVLSGRRRRPLKTNEARKAYSDLKISADATGRA